MKFPESIRTEEELDTLLATPYPETIEMMKHLKGDIMILGVGGKMGPTLAKLAIQACIDAGVKKRIVGVSRFSEKNLPEKLSSWGIETISCDLLNSNEVAKLPQIRNIIFMAGRKFGSHGSESLTWMMNTIVPYNVAQTFSKSKFVIFSTGCVYPLVSPFSNGCTETDPLQSVGEYANSCLGRERVFEYYSEIFIIPTLFYRLNYAIDLRYGVLVDIAQKVYNRIPVDLSVKSVNVIWQGDANNRALLCLQYTSSPPNILNITGNERLSTESIALEFGKLFNTDAQFTGMDSGKCYLSNAQKSIQLFGNPHVPVPVMLKWVANWIKQGGALLGKPTHFQVTNGRYLD